MPNNERGLEQGEKLPLLTLIKNIPQREGFVLTDIIEPYIPEPGLEAINNALKAVSFNKFKVVLTQEGKYILASAKKN